jgi:uncharacterized protein
MTNRLSSETSPYLRQHAQNPVDWFPWGEEALTRARAEDRPILLSIGYSSCHWCHVMERESFEDPEVAAVMNEHFVNIKVDREERPDLDQVYMKAVQAMTGGGGWPMTVFLTPDGVPFYGGTYFPPAPRHGLPSFTQVLRAAADAYRNRGDMVRASGEHLLSALASAAARTGPDGVGPDTLDAAVRSLARQFDPVHGGFGKAPKFPQPVTLELLMRQSLRTGDREPLEMAVHTLRRMAAGGVRDHLGGGFHRYSVDARWLVPHFEKMLYDNALLARAYLHGHLLTGDSDFRDVAEETLDYLAGDMRLSEGGFASARDADSEGEEGLFYVWTSEELESLLEPDDARLFARLYDASPGGNFEGRSILHLPHAPEAIAQAEGVSPAELRRRVAAARTVLLEARGRREPPFRDDKVLVSWNALAIRAFAEAGAALDRPDYVRIAAEAADFLWRALRSDDRLLHVYMDGEAKVLGFLDDHAGLGNALLSLHAATLEPRWLEAARWLSDEILTRFWDEAEGSAFDTAADAERLILRPRDSMDNATPSGPSLAAELLTRAAAVFGEESYRSAAMRIIERESAMLAQFGPAFGRMLSVLDSTLASPVEVAIVGTHEGDATSALITAAHARFVRNVTIVGRFDGDEVRGVPLLEDRGLREGKPTAYVCRGHACRLPVTRPEDVHTEMAALLGG